MRKYGAFRALYNAKGYSRAQLARALGCSVYTIDDWGNGRCAPHLWFYLKMQELLGAEEVEHFFRNEVQVPYPHSYRNAGRIALAKQKTLEEIDGSRRAGEESQED